MASFSRKCIFYFLMLICMDAPGFLIGKNPKTTQPIPKKNSLTQQTHRWLTSVTTLQHDYATTHKMHSPRKQATELMQKITTIIDDIVGQQPTSRSSLKRHLLTESSGKNIPLYAQTEYWLDGIKDFFQEYEMLASMPNASEHVHYFLTKIITLIDDITTQKINPGYKRNPITPQEFIEVSSILKTLKEQLSPILKETQNQKQDDDYKKTAVMLNIAGNTLMTLTGIVYLIYRMVHG